MSSKVSSDNHGGSDMDTKKRSLFEELRKKMGLEMNEENTSTHKNSNQTERLQGNKNAARDSRNIHLGWLHNGKLVRFKTGGGTRKVKVDKGTKKEALIQASKNIFSEGISRRGNETDFDYDILDYSQCPMPADVSVSDIYDQTKAVGYIRFYLSSKIKKMDNAAENCPLGPEDNQNRATPTEKTEHEMLRVVDSSPPSLVQNVHREQQTILSTPASPLKHALETIDEIDTYQLDEHQQSTLFEDLHPLYRPSLNETIHYPIESTPSPYNSPSHSVHNTESLNNISPVPREKLFRFHRCNILPEVIQTFKTDIIYSPMKVELVGEKGSDADGVSRDVYTLFWKDFYDKCEGEVYRVPVITPEYGIPEWESVARIMCKGFIDHRIFPLSLAPALMISLIHDENILSPEELLESFKFYNNGLDREIINTVLENGPSELSDDDRDCFLDILGRCGSNEIPTGRNEKELLTKVAHKCIIQMPCYATKAMKGIVQQHLSPFFPNKESVFQVYEECKPSAKKLCQLLKVSDDMDAEETKSLSFLKQFIRGLNIETLTKLLVLMTASSMISVENVSVRFTKLRGLERRPIFHTCGPVLELPCTYTSYRDFRQEWTSLIEGGYLSMDIA